MIYLCNIDYFQGQINLPAKVLLEKLYYGTEYMPSWNPTVIESKILKVI